MLEIVIHLDTLFVVVWPGGHLDQLHPLAPHIRPNTYVSAALPCPIPFESHRADDMAGDGKVEGAARAV